MRRARLASRSARSRESAAWSTGSPCNPARSGPSAATAPDTPSRVRTAGASGPGIGGELQVRQMQVDERPGIGQSHERRDTRTEVASARPVANVAKTSHEPVPQRGHVAVGHPACHSWPSGEAIARKGGDHHVERRLVDAIRRRVGQQRDQRQQLDEATRPAMTQNQRDPPAAKGRLVHEMNRGPANLGPVLGETVQLALLSPPVEHLRPVPDQPPLYSHDRYLVPTAHQAPAPAGGRSGSSPAGRQQPPGRSEPGKARREAAQPPQRARAYLPSPAGPSLARSSSCGPGFRERQYQRSRNR